eukprot:c19599_g3_i2.p1 GENE.c19599_g3_i2~~c19599_g3_i2.p1  ORF type:complete len:200 (-),score=43.49 c19599_g3_i2:281-880(-)
MIDIGWYDFTPMGLAAAHGTSEMVRLMQEFGGDVNGTNKDGSTPMHYAALYGHVEVVQVLTSSGFGADVNKPNDTGHTSMHCAAEEGHVEVVQVLHRFGGDVNKASDDGVTPLMMACDKGCVSLVKLLIGFGANMSLFDKVSILCPSVALTIFSLLINFHLILGFPFLLGVRSQRGLTARDIAVENGYTAIVSALDEVS